MAKENALEASGESCAGSPTGFRRLTPSLLRADHAAEGFNGLPDGVTMPGQLLAALKSAASRLGLSPRLVHAVDWLFRFTQPQDWGRGGRPIVWPSASLQQEAFGLSPSQVKAVNRQLIEAGLITMRDSPNGKRYGHRSPRTGQIIEAYGFDLSPIAARYGEFMRLAEEARAERAAIGRLRRRATIARKAIAQILETAAEYGFQGGEWTRLAHDTQHLVRALRKVEMPDEIALGVESLERRHRQARERLENLLAVLPANVSEAVNSDPKGPENRPHYLPTNQVQDQNDTVAAIEEGSRTGSEAVAPPPGIAAAGNAGEGQGVEAASGRSGAAGATVEALSAATEPDLARDHRCRCFPAIRPRRVEIAMGRGLPGDGPRAGGDRGCHRLDQGPGAFPDDGGWVFPRHGGKGQGRRAQSRPHPMGHASCC